MARSKEVFRRPDSPVYYTRIRGRKVSTGETSEKAAIAWRHAQLRAVQNPTSEAARTVTVGDVLNYYVGTREAKGLAEDTLSFYRKKCANILATVGENTLASVLTPDIVDRYVTARRSHKTNRVTKTVQDASIVKELAVLRAALTLAKRRGRWSGDLDVLFPAQGDFSAGYDPSKSAERALSRADVAALMRNMPAEKFAVLAYAVATGCGLSALARAKREDVDAGAGFVTVRGSKNKNRKDRPVPIVMLEQAMLLDFALTHATGINCLFPSLGNIRRDCIAAAAKAGVHHFSPHNVRHTLGLWLTTSGVSSAATGAVLGHADGRMVERTYGHLSRAADLRATLISQFRPATGTDLGHVSGEAGEHGTPDKPLTFKITAEK